MAKNRFRKCLNCTNRLPAHRGAFCENCARQTNSRPSNLGPHGPNEPSCVSTSNAVTDTAFSFSCGKTECAPSVPCTGFFGMAPMIKALFGPCKISCETHEHLKEEHDCHALAPLHSGEAPGEETSSCSPRYGWTIKNLEVFFIACAISIFAVAIIIYLLL